MNFSFTYSTFLFEGYCSSGITHLTPSANVLASANKASGILYFIKRSLTCLTNEISVRLYSGLMRPHLEYAIQANCSYLKKDINHLEWIQRWVKGLRGLTSAERLQALNLEPLEKTQRNDLVLTHNMLYNHIDLEVSQLFRFFRKARTKPTIN